MRGHIPDLHACTGVRRRRWSCSLRATVISMQESVRILGLKNQRHEHVQNNLRGLFCFREPWRIGARETRFPLSVLGELSGLSATVVCSFSRTPTRPHASGHTLLKRKLSSAAARRIIGARSTFHRPCWRTLSAGILRAIIFCDAARRSCSSFGCSQAAKPYAVALAPLRIRFGR